MATRTIVRLADQAAGFLTNASASTTYQAKVANVSDAEIGYLDGVTSGIQSQINSKLSTSSASTTYLTQASASTTYAPITPTTQTGFRNAIINGDMRIDQRNSGNSITITAGSALVYTVDRWYAFCTGANATVGRASGATAYLPHQFLLTAIGNTGNTSVGFGHRIESVNSFHLAGKTATLSAMIRTVGPTSVTWAAYYANTTDTFGTLASPTRTQIATGTFTTNTSYTVYSTNISIPIAATTGIEIVFTTGALLSTQILNVTGVQLELGTIATPFEKRPIGTELALCQRYYVSETCQLNGYTDQAGTPSLVRYFSVWLPVTMRTAPTAGNISGTTVAGAATVYGTPTARQISFSRSVGTSSVGTDLTSYSASAEL